MIRLFLRLIKWLAVVGLVLWFGQTPIGSSTVAAEFRLWTTRIWEGDFKREVRREVVTGIQKQIKEPIRKWIRPKVGQISSPKRAVFGGEGISEDDREALKKLLAKEEGR